MMERIRIFVIFTMLLTLTTTSIQCQPADFQEDGNYGSAYLESNQAAHWSAYVPIGIMVVAAIWFGVADRHHEHESSSSSRSSSSGSYSHSRSSYSYGCHCH